MAFKEHSAIIRPLQIQQSKSNFFNSNSTSSLGNWQRDAEVCCRRARPHSSFTIMNMTPTTTLNRGARINRPPRSVPPFSIQAQQKNTVVWRGPLLDSGINAQQATRQTKRIAAKRGK